MRLPWPFPSSHPDRDPEADARRFDVDVVFYLDVPRWWLRLTAPLSRDWRREAAFFVALVLVGFGFGVLVGALVLR